MRTFGELKNDLIELQSVSGGSIAASFQAMLKDGSRVFVKTVNGDSDMFAKEAMGLELLKSEFLRIPRVLEVGRDFLMLEFIERYNPSDRYWKNLGEGLAKFHSCGFAPRPGADFNNYIGSTEQINIVQTWQDWAEFFWNNRLRFIAEKMNNRHISDALDLKRGKIFEILANVHEFSPLHGDLWSGNTYSDEEGRGVLFDPAFYYGDSESDLAMTELFGGFAPLFYQSYKSVKSLSKNYSAKRNVYQLYHILNHGLIFGGSYLQQAHSMISII